MQPGRECGLQCIIHKPVGGHPVQPGQGRGRDAHPKMRAMALAVGPRVAGMRRALVDDLQARGGEGRAQQLSYVIERTDAEIAELEKKRAQIDETLAELRVINQYSRTQLENRQHLDAKN